MLNKPMLVPDGVPTSLGSVIFAMKAAGAYATITDAQDALCLPYKSYEPKPEEAARAAELFQLYKAVYFAMGRVDGPAVSLGNVLPALKQLREKALAV